MHVLVAGLIVVAACGGKVVDDDTSGRRQSGATAGEGDPPASAGSTGGTPAAPSCTYEGTGMGSSGGDPSGVISCLFSEDYSCTTGPKRVLCECEGKVGRGFGMGACSCGDGEKFEIDCTGGCTDAVAAAAKRCGLPPRK
jgi:hypothetical protein